MTKPTILKDGKYNEGELGDFQNKSGVKVVDIYENQLKEFFEIENPTLAKKESFDAEFQKYFKVKTAKGQHLVGDWVYFDWNNTIVHILGEKEIDALRTNRNRNIISEEEQQKLGQFTVGIVGLSVGGNIATTLAYGGISKKMKVADFDILETSNLNRVRGKLSDIESPKIDVISKQLYELDPYMSIIPFPDGLTKENMRKFLSGTNLIFEIIDSLELKILIRKEAKKHKIPVVMLTSIGDSVMIDVERYDIDPDTKIFNGKVSEEVIDDLLSGKVSKEEVNKYVVQIVGMENIPPKVMDSVKKIGTELVGRPQLMSTVTVASGIASYVARKIALGEHMPNGRSLFKFEDLVNG